ncbi:MAG TPA: urea transporter, partial [Planctomycetaceae bacterium]|nr:urea transporter [Planctomycetaceae bacterium]
AESLHIGEIDIHMGMFSYSAILTAIAIGGLFYLLNLRGFVYTVFGIVFTTWLYAALAAVLQPLHLPAYTAPFVLVTWIMLYSKSVFQGLVAIPPAEATTPEGNLQRYREAGR